MVHVFQLEAEASDLPAIDWESGAPTELVLVLLRKLEGAQDQVEVEHGVGVEEQAHLRHQIHFFDQQMADVVFDQQSQLLGDRD